jgi:glycosyltransferase involved in cell wall biosynthesis
MAEVSIIINNHNYCRYLGDAIDSALAQDFPATEVIVVDDGSTDDSAKVIEGYGSRIHAVFQDNGGQGSAFNAGFAASYGDVIAFLDADDRLLPDAARRAVAALADPAIVQWLTPLAMIDSDGRPLGQTFPRRRLPSGDLRQLVLSYGPWAYQVTPTTGNFWSRAYLAQVLPLPADQFRIGGDEYLSALAPLYGRLASTERPAGCYRVHGANAYWRRTLSVDDVAEDCFYFDRIATLLAEHAARLGLAAEPERWAYRDWRQQLRQVLLSRTGRRTAPPGRLTARLVNAALADQTHPLRKAVLLPLLVTVAALPVGAATALGLRLLAR